jgi:hypothetical protein
MACYGDSFTFFFTLNDSLCTVLFWKGEISPLFVPGTTERHRLRSSIDDNKDEHCDYWVTEAP